MATTTKSTKAKTKTSKAKSTKSRTASASAAKKTTSKKVSKPAAKATTQSVSNLTPLQKVYAVSIAVYVAIAGAAYMLMTTASHQLSLGYLTKDELASESSTVFAPATQGIVDVQVRYLVMAVAILSVVAPVLYLAKLKSYHQKSLKQKVLLPRWIDMAVVSAIMVETVAILSGIVDIATLKVVGGLMVVTMILGLMAEKRTAEAGKPATAKYYLSMVTGLLPWVLIAFYAVSTVLLGEVRSAWYVYALYAVMLAGAGVIGSYQLKALRAQGELKNYELVERNYAVLSLATRTAFAAILIAGLMVK